MTPAQRTALTNACYLGGETVHPRFRQQIGSWSVVLTVNSGYE